MNAIQDLFQQAQLAEAAYADLLKNGVLVAGANDLEAALVANDFSPAQASAFVEQWRVVDQYTASSWGGFAGSGFSATVFQNISTGQYVFAVRGTEPSKVNDLQADVFGIGAQGIALRQAIDLYNCSYRLNSRQFEEVVPV